MKLGKRVITIIKIFVVFLAGNRAGDPKEDKRKTKIERKSRDIDITLDPSRSVADVDVITV